MNAPTYPEQKCGTKDTSLSRHPEQKCGTKSADRSEISDIVGSSRGEKLWGRGPLLAIVNQALSDAGYRFLNLLSVPGIEGTAVPVEELAAAMGWSKRKVEKKLAEIVRLGVIEVSRAPNQPNAYRLKEGVFNHMRRETRTERVMKAKPKFHPCESCRRLTPMKAIYCKTCLRDKRVEQISRRVAREEIAKPA